MASARWTAPTSSSTTRFVLTDSDHGFGADHPRWFGSADRLLADHQQHLRTVIRWSEKPRCDQRALVEQPCHHRVARCFSSSASSSFTASWSSGSSRCAANFEERDQEFATPGRHQRYARAQVAGFHGLVGDDLDVCFRAHSDQKFDESTIVSRCARSSRLPLRVAQRRGMTSRGTSTAPTQPVEAAVRPRLVHRRSQRRTTPSSVPFVEEGSHSVTVHAAGHQQSQLRRSTPSSSSSVSTTVAALAGFGQYGTTGSDMPMIGTARRPSEPHRFRPPSPLDLSLELLLIVLDLDLELQLDLHRTVHLEVVSGSNSTSL